MIGPSASLLHGCDVITWKVYYPELMLKEYKSPFYPMSRVSSGCLVSSRRESRHGGLLGFRAHSKWHMLLCRDDSAIVAKLNK